MFDLQCHIRQMFYEIAAMLVGLPEHTACDPPLSKRLSFCRANLDIRKQFDDPHHRRMIEIPPPLCLHCAK
jgi:hypothetical protein